MEFLAYTVVLSLTETTCFSTPKDVFIYIPILHDGRAVVRRRGGGYRYQGKLPT